MVQLGGGGGGGVGRRYAAGAAALTAHQPARLSAAVAGHAVALVVISVSIAIAAAAVSVIAVAADATVQQIAVHWLLLLACGLLLMVRRISTL